MPSAAWGTTRRSVCRDRPATASRGENRMAIAKPSLPWPCGRSERVRKRMKGQSESLKKKETTFSESRSTDR